jgi:isopentenyl-diphosphate Delta-isomerase
MLRLPSFRAQQRALRIPDAMSLPDRKRDHLTLCAEGEVGFRAKTTLLEEVQLIHQSLPELAWDEIRTDCRVFGKSLRAPLVVAAMTGGTAEAKRVNRALAEIAEELGCAFGLGSQRIMQKDPTTAHSFQVRDVAPTLPLFGNIGVMQAKQLSTESLNALIAAVSADALCVHLNPAMELIQEDGDRDFRGALETLARLKEELSVPVIAKETGSGLSLQAGSALRRIGIDHVDVSGAGGTSWVGVEAERAKASGHESGRAIGESLWDWGIPTAASVAWMARTGFTTVIATGGIKSGYDAARAIALGATLVGIARPMLQAFTSGGASGAKAFLSGIIRELRTIMLLTGAKDAGALRSAPRHLGPTIQGFLAL